MKNRICSLVIVLIMLIVFSVISSGGAGGYIYLVKKGDSLSQIARNFKLSRTEILAANKIDNPDLIYPGQRLQIPGMLKEYRVKEGDSLWKIARENNLEITDILACNSLSDENLIKTGQVISLPLNMDRDRYQLATRRTGNHYIWPALGQISSEYGYRIHPISKRREFHSGLDIAIPLGSPVYAAETGVVKFSGYNNGYGNLIIIEHRDNQLTYYAHNFVLLVKKGQLVKQGKIIALSGSTGVSTGPHLHFEIRNNGRSVNPLELLNQRYLRTISIYK